MGNTIIRRTLTFSGDGYLIEENFPCPIPARTVKNLWP
jgi:hypothetical protein